VDKKKWLIVGAVGIVSALLVAAAFASRGGETNASRDDAAGEAQTASSVNSQDAATDGSVTTSGTSANGPGAGSTTQGQSQPSGGADDPTPGTVVAPAGKPLEKVTQPPSHTLAMLNADAAKAGTTYDIVFEPYGTGPQSDASSVAVLVVSAKVREGAKAPDLNGRNVLLVLAPGEVVAKGGSYAAVVTLTARGETLVPIASNVRASDK